DLNRAAAVDPDRAVLPGGIAAALVRRRRAAALDVAGEADAHDPARGAGGVALPQQLRVVAVREQRVERLGVVAAVVGEAGDGAVGEGVGGNEVAAADLHRVDPQL